MSCLKKFSLWFFTGLLICIVGISDVFGLETKTIYSNQTLDNSNQFNYGFVNSGGVDSITTGSVGSRISGKTKYINFYLSQNVALNYTYTIRINFLADDLQPYFSLNHVKEISVCNSSSCSNSSIISIKKQNNNGFSTWVELTFNPTQLGNVIGVTLGDNSGTYITGETFFGISSVQIESKNANQDVIDNATNNTNNIINNNNSNTESIINNNNSNNEALIDSNRICNFIDNKQIEINGKYLLSDGSYGTNSYYGVTQYINISNKDSLKLVTSQNSSAASLCFYNINKDLISCNTLNNYQDDSIVIIPTTASYFRSSILINENKPTFNLCRNGNQALNDSLNNSDSSGATSDASEFFSGFTTDTFGLTSIITAPLNLIGSITSSTCTPLGLPLPYVNKTIELPCMSSIYSQYFGSFFTLYQTITFGIIAYWVCVRIFNLVKDFKNPDHDEIEVLDL